MTTIKEFNSKTFQLSSEDKNNLINENIIFLDFTPKNNLLLLLSSHNIFYLVEIVNNSIKTKKKFESIVESNIKINKSYFCNENPNLVLLFCDNCNILEWTVDREYISHIYYDVLGNTYEFKMNCDKNWDISNDINNFCILKEREISVWNAMKYNKKNVLNINDVNCFSYDFTGLLLYLVTKVGQKTYIKVIKFIDEYEFKELYNKSLGFISKADIDYINSFDVNIIVADTKLGKMFILKNHPIKNIELYIEINKSQLYFPLIGQNPFDEFKVLCLDIKDNEQTLITFSFAEKKYNIENIQLHFSNLFYYKENNKGKGILLVFNELKKELKQYEI